MLAAMTLAAEGDWAAAVAGPGRRLRVGEEVDDRDVLWNLGNAALQLGDDDGAAALLLACPVAGSRGRRGHGGRLRLQRLCFGHFLAGDCVAVRSSAEEALALA